MTDINCRSPSVACDKWHNEHAQASRCAPGSASPPSTLLEACPRELAIRTFEPHNSAAHLVALHLLQAALAEVVFMLVRRPLQAPAATLRDWWNQTCTLPILCKPSAAQRITRLRPHSNHHSAALRQCLSARNTTKQARTPPSTCPTPSPDHPAAAVRHAARQCCLLPSNRNMLDSPAPEAHRITRPRPCGTPPQCSSISSLHASLSGHWKSMDSAIASSAQQGWVCM